MFAIAEFFFALLAVFFFGALPFEQLFFGHLVVVAGGEHGAAPAALGGTQAAALPAAGRKVTHAADGVVNGARFYQQFADFFEEVVKMVRLEQIGKAFFLEDRLGIASGE